jgi:hypothetical protein
MFMFKKKIRREEDQNEFQQQSMAATPAADDASTHALENQWVYYEHKKMVRASQMPPFARVAFAPSPKRCVLGFPTP